MKFLTNGCVSNLLFICTGSKKTVEQNCSVSSRAGPECVKFHTILDKQFSPIFCFFKAFCDSKY